MSKEVLYCFEDEATEHVAKNMSEQKVRRLPVVDRKKRLVGIVSIGDLALSTKPNVTGQAVAGISNPVARIRRRRTDMPTRASGPGNISDG